MTTVAGRVYGTCKETDGLSPKRQKNYTQSEATAFPTFNTDITDITPLCGMRTRSRTATSGA